jgi:nitrogen regulatory protein P-II 2
LKRIDAVIRQESLDNVRKSLTDLGVEGFTMTEVKGFGRQKVQTDVYRGIEYHLYFHSKVLLTIIARDEQITEIVDAITQSARTGAVGDGKIFISSLEEIIRIRTGEIGPAAC